jgi:hypothetical protein
VAERLDEDRLEVLRTWGAGLSASGRDELRAAGKAIVMLVEEIDRLQADVWMAGEVAAQRARVEAETAAATEDPALPEPADEPEHAAVHATTTEALARSLSERIARGRVPSEPAA